MNHDAEYYTMLIVQLDEGPFDITKWEADFLASLLDSPGRRLTERQQAVLDDMATKYEVQR